MRSLLVENTRMWVCGFMPPTALLGVLDVAEGGAGCVVARSRVKRFERSYTIVLRGPLLGSFHRATFYFYLFFLAGPSLGPPWLIIQFTDRPFVGNSRGGGRGKCPRGEIIEVADARCYPFA